jgi:hypothetical protein
MVYNFKQYSVKIAFRFHVVSSKIEILITLVSHLSLGPVPLTHAVLEESNTSLNFNGSILRIGSGH